MDVEKQYGHPRQSEVGFAFCYLLGFALLPRLKNIKKQRLYRPDKEVPRKYANLQPKADSADQLGDHRTAIRFMMGYLAGLFRQ